MHEAAANSDANGGDDVKTRNRKGMLLACLFSVLLVITACAPTGPAQEDTYKIGVSVNLTGVNADFAESCVAGAEVAVDHINSSGGVLGRQIELIIRDDKLDPDEAARIMKEFVYDLHVDAVLLSPPNVCQIPQIRIGKEAGMLAFAQQGQTMEMLNDYMYPYLFNVGPTAYQEARALAEYVARRDDVDSFITFAPDYSWGHENADAFKASVQELRPDIKCAGQFWPPLEELEFGSYITSMMTTDADIVLTWVFGTTFVSFVKQAADYGLKDQMDILAWVHQDMLYEAGADMQSGVIVEGDNEYWSGRLVGGSYYEKFEKDYLEKRGRLPALGGCQHYDMVRTLVQGIEKAGSFDKDEIAKALEAGTFQTLRGEHRMRAINHTLDTGLFFGVTKYDDSLGYCDVVDVLEIPGPDVWRNDSDYITYRSEHQCDFVPWCDR